MSRKIRAAAIQLEAAPAAAPAAVRERRARAGRLIHTAAQSGAELVLLPELFNLGYSYSDQNFLNAEDLDGPTISWMRQQSAALQVHVAGSLLVKEDGEVFNALILTSPEGRLWRYDKRYPWGWERAYFRAGTGVTIAHTSIGAIGLLICWDVAHPNMWRSYAGQVDLLLISTCPPDVTDPLFLFPDQSMLSYENMGPIFRRVRHSASKIFGASVQSQTAWLGIPVIQSTACGTVDTMLPNPEGTFLSMLPLVPQAARLLPQASKMRMICKLVPGCRILDANGCELDSILPEEGEAFALAEIEIPLLRAVPAGPQPRLDVPFISYLLSDYILPFLSLSTYQLGRIRLAPEKFPPGRARKRQAAGLLVAAGLFLAGLLVLHTKPSWPRSR